MFFLQARAVMNVLESLAVTATGGILVKLFIQRIQPRIEFYTVEGLGTFKRMLRRKFRNEPEDDVNRLVQALEPTGENEGDECSLSKFTQRFGTVERDFESNHQRF